MSDRASESFPRQSARTRRFTLGQPRTFRVAADGSRVAFLRSRAGDDPLTCLWTIDVPDGRERLICDPRALGARDEDVPPEERTRRERARETASGIVAYTTDRDLRVAAFVIGSALYTADLVTGEVQPLPAAGPVVDPRMDPTGHRVGYVTHGALHVVDLAGADRRIVGEESPDVTWGLAEFVAAEEMDRLDGFWWAPDGESLLVERADVSGVDRWRIASPIDPDRVPEEVAYPAAGRANADVSLSLFGPDGSVTEVEWDRGAFPYLTRVTWTPGTPPTLAVQSRDQRRMLVLAVDPGLGTTEPVGEDADPAWVDVVPGVPEWLPDGRLVRLMDVDDRRRLAFDDEPVTPPGLHVRDVADVGERGVVFSAWESDPTEIHVYRLDADVRLERLSEEPGVHAAAAGGQVVVLMSASMEHAGMRTVILKDGSRVAEVASHAEAPVLAPSVAFLRLGERRLSSALLLPSSGDGDGPFPVLLDPYGGPQLQRVTKVRNSYLESQWFADQGFAVLVTDGRGTPGRGTSWEREIHRDLATKPLQDQVDALYAAAEREPRLDLSRVAIRGWSFGGYLAALAVLRRPDVFHAAVAGAPVSDWRLYDTHYTERYLGDPNDEPEVYARTSLLGDAAKLERPLLLIHGLADDNVVVAHTLRLSRALLEAGKPHVVLPLSGVTHMTPQEVVAENLLLLQISFLRDALGL